MRVLAEFGGLGGLAANGIQLSFDLAHDVSQAQQILGHAFELALRVDFAGLEAADARGLFEDAPAGDVCGLQELIDAALLDDAVRRTPGSRPEKKIADVFKPGRHSVDEIFRLPRAVDAAANLHFVDVEGKHALPIVEVEQGLGERRRFAVGRAIEDDVGHLLSAQAFRALVAEDPLDRIDDVALAAAVGTDDTGNAGGEFEAGAVGEALEAEQIERLEHRCSSGRPVVAVSLSFPSKNRLPGASVVFQKKLTGCRSRGGTIPETRAGE